jgi:caffeoyl-CoA O-methyltransferase
MPEPFSYSDVQSYITNLVPTRADELSAMEDYANQHGFPIIGPAAGYLCYQMARLIGARRVFELGSGYGYSTAWFAQAVQENGGGEVHHVVWDEDLSRRARGHMDAMGYQELVRFHVGEAVSTLRDVDGPFDLIFNDIDKQMYPESLEVLAPKLRSGGLLIIDNMLWGGGVLDDRDQSEAARGVREATRMLADQDAWISSLVPVRDGVIVAMKR